MIKKIVITCVVSIIAVILFIITAHWIISSKSKDYVYNDIDIIPENKVGLLLGTSKYNAGGNINAYYKYRIDAAIRLYKAGKIHYVVVSGDNSSKTYNEPGEMKEDLIAGGIPAEKIYPDYAGFRTLDSVVRINKIFGQEKFTVISQKFHNERAIYIAQRHGLEAVGYDARDVNSQYGLKTRIRERFARVKVFIDLLTRKQPKYLGEEIRID